MNTDTFMVPTWEAYIPEHELAWTQEYVHDQVNAVYRHSWKVTAGLSMSILATAAAAAFMFMSDFGHASTTTVDSSPVTTSQTPDPTYVSAPNMVNQVSAAQYEDGTGRSDHIYLSILRQNGFDVGSETDAIDYGHIICKARGAGLPEQKVIEIESEGHPEVGFDGATTQVRAAETVYCSQYLN